MGERILAPPQQKHAPHAVVYRRPLGNEKCYWVTTVWQCIFAGSNVCGFFEDPQKKFPRKKISRKNLLHGRNYIQDIAFDR